MVNTTWRDIMTLEGKRRRWHPPYPWEDWFARDYGFTVHEHEWGGRLDTFVQQIKNKMYGVYHRRATITVSPDAKTITVTWKE
jgi:hypothetical protein